MAINNEVIPMERGSHTNDGDVMSQRFAAFIDEITRQVNHSIIAESDGSPEGVVTAEPRKLCIDTTNDALYYKKTGSGNTGWQLL
jgi:hypothetical protein